MLISQNTCETSFLFPLAALKLEASIALKGSKEIKRGHVTRRTITYTYAWDRDTLYLNVSA